MIGLVCAYFTYTDLNAFQSKPNQNLYGLIGFDRYSDAEFINNRLDLAARCHTEMSGEACSEFNNEKVRDFNMTDLDDIRFVFVERPDLRELYNKNEIFLRKGLENSPLYPSKGQRYLSAFSELSTFSVFIIITMFYVEKHQNFAKKCVIGSLLIFATIAFSLKEPREGDDDNSVVKFINDSELFADLTFFELSYLVKSVVFPSIFQMALHMSRMVDKNPLEGLQMRLRRA